MLILLERIKNYAAWCIPPLGVGVTAGLLTREGMKIFEQMNQPTLTPPSWVFPVAWTALYVSMGISARMVDLRKEEGEKRPLTLYAFQLAVNFLWPIFFFSFQWYFFSLLWLILLWVLVAKMALSFGKVYPLAGKLMIPYLLWLTFAAYLNAGVWYLN